MSIEDHIASTKASLLNEMAQQTAIVYNGLILEATVAQIPESLFVNYFLPCFLHETVNPNWVVEWIGIAGTPMAEVEVVQDGTGAPLFRVPGILSTNTLQLNSVGTNIENIFTRYEQLKANIPIQGVRFLDSALSNKAQEATTQVTLSSANAAWEKILRRYGRIQDTTTSAPQQSAEDYFDY